MDIRYVAFYIYNLVGNVKLYSTLKKVAIFYLQIPAICFFAFLMSQIEEQNMDDVDSFNDRYKDRCNPEPASFQRPFPVNLQEVDIFPGPHSYISRNKNLSPKVINGKKAAKATCGEEVQNGEAILQTNESINDKKNDKESSGKKGCNF